MDQEYEAELENQTIEIRLLLEAIYLKYGYDFREYAQAHIKRRLIHRLKLSGVSSITMMQEKLLYDRKFFEELLGDLSINVTEMFRDPSFYSKIREEVVPVLKTYPFVRIWYAGCATGEEVYSLAIALQEEGIYDRCQIYATDFNEHVLQKAQDGIYPMSRMKKDTENYLKAGGRTSLSNYYTAHYDSVIFHQSLKKKLVFANHNLVSDGVFGEMHMIICRNVLIYFNQELQNKVIRLFSDSLVNGGFLGLGIKESLQFYRERNAFKVVDNRNKIYRKIWRISN